MATEDLQGGKIHNLSGPVFSHPNHKEMFLDVQKEPVHAYGVLALATIELSLAPSSCILS